MKKMDAGCVLHDFAFTNGQQMPELKIHYTTLGDRALDAGGRTTNAVLLLHPTTGTSKNFFIRVETRAEHLTEHIWMERAVLFPGWRAL